MNDGNRPMLSKPSELCPHLIESTLKGLCNVGAVARMNCPRLGRDDYSVGWICALPVELKAARAMLDEQHQLPAQRDVDNNSYTVGHIGIHNVVIAVLPAGRIDTNLLPPLDLT
jgi:hypothetical protein